MRFLLVLKIKIILALLFFTAFVFGHPGGLDRQGGHRNKSTGEYHCHKPSCSAAIEEAVSEARPFSYTYQREDWKHWSDFDRDCMNTRHEILLSQADGPVKRSKDTCYVSVGTWHDPFSGKTLNRASDLDVDHIIPLKWANDHGGANWSQKKKERFANDPKNLLAVDDGLNQSKGAKGPTEWLPPNHAFRCEYLKMWVSILNIYPTLKMTASESRIFTRQLKACG